MPPTSHDDLGSTPIIIDAGDSSIIRKAIIVKVDFGTALLEHVNDIVEGAKSICVFGTARMGFVEGDDGVVAIIFSR